MAAPDGVVKLADGRAITPALISGFLTRREPAVSANGSRLFTPCSTQVCCFSLKTAQQIGALVHSSEVTAVCSGASRAECAEPLATGTASGVVQLWDTRTLTSLSTVNVEGPVAAIRWPRPERLLVVVGAKGQSAKVLHLEVLELNELRRAEDQPPLEVPRFAAFDAVEGAVALASGKELVVWMEGWLQSSTHKISRGCALTTVCIDPLRRYVAAGDTEGVVWLSWQLLDERGAHDDQVRPEKLHWHSDGGVKSLSHCGLLLLSGGEEGVLCKWRPDDDSRPTFTPRLGGVLSHIVCSGSGLCCISLGNNSILIFDNLQAFLPTTRYIYGMDLPAERHAKTHSDLPLQEASVLHRLSDGSSAITCSGRRVHFFDSRRGSLLSTAKMPLGMSNVVQMASPERWMLHNIAFSPDASSIMTFETRMSPSLKKFDAAASRSGVLKWWRRLGENDYVLDTVSNNVHGAEISVALALPQKQGLFVTGSLDGYFKCWEYLPLDDEGKSCWQCIAAGGWRAQPIKSGCCSVDGSMLALGYAGAIVLWEPRTAVELHVLALDDSAHEAVGLFCVVACGRFMLVAHVSGADGLDEVVCWDLTSMDVVSRVDLREALPGAGPAMMRGCAPQHPSGDLHLLAYRPPSAELSDLSGGNICLWNLASGAATFALEAAASVTAGRTLLDVSFAGRGSHLLCWTSSYELWHLDFAEPSRDAKEKAAQEEVEEVVAGRGKVAKVLGQRSTEARATAVSTAVSLLDLPLRTTPAQQVGLTPHLVERVIPANAPSHMLPPPSSIWAGVFSVWGKRWHEQQGASTESPNGTAVEAANADDEARAIVFEDRDVPTWARTSGRLLSADTCRSEFVDFQFMDSLLKEAAATPRVS